MFKRLKVHQLRALEKVDILPSSGVNLIFGSNGAGKTSLLEAVYLLMHGHSFRHRDVVPLIQQGHESLHVFAQFVGQGRLEYHLGMKRTQSELAIRLNGKSSIRRSDILSLLPLTWIGSDPQLLLTSAPDMRRSFLDRGLFHVEPAYLAQLKKYHRALAQRNAALKHSPSAANTWDSVMSDAGEKIDAWRDHYVARLKEKVLFYIALWKQALSIEIEYKRGWSSSINLLDMLQTTFETDKKLKFTTQGVHRADFRVCANHIKSGKLLSRGQLKMLVCAFHFAQVSLVKEIAPKPTVLLFDDLSAELDFDNRADLLNTVNDLYEQSFITALNKEDICFLQQPEKMFHVEQGRLSEI